MINIGGTNYTQHDRIRLNPVYNMRTLGFSKCLKLMKSYKTFVPHKDFLKMYLFENNMKVPDEDTELLMEDLCGTLRQYWVLKQEAKYMQIRQYILSFFDRKIPIAIPHTIKDKLDALTKYGHGMTDLAFDNNMFAIFAMVTLDAHPDVEGTTDDCMLDETIVAKWLDCKNDPTLYDAVLRLITLPFDMRGQEDIDSYFTRESAPIEYLSNSNYLNKYVPKYSKEISPASTQDIPTIVGHTYHTLGINFGRVKGNFDKHFNIVREMFCAEKGDGDYLSMKGSNY